MVEINMLIGYFICKVSECIIYTNVTDKNKSTADDCAFFYESGISYIFTFENGGRLMSQKSPSKYL